MRVLSNSANWKLCTRIFMLVMLGSIMCWHGVARAAQGVDIASAQWRLSIKKAATVEQDVVRLSDIATPVGPLSQADWQALGTTELWKSPRNYGGQMDISREKLRNLLGYYLEDIVRLCIIPGHLTIQKGGRIVEGAELQKMLVESLTPQLRSLPGENSLRDFRVPEFVFLRDTQNTLDTSIKGQLKPGRVSLRIQEKGLDGHVFRKFSGTAFLDSWRTVACAATPLNSKEELSPENVTFVRKNAAFLRGTPWDGKRFGMRVMRPVGAGQVIYADVLDNVPVIARGDRVTVVYQKKHIRLTMTGKAMEDGSIGDSILVRNMQSRRDVSGVVQGAGTVVIK
ncbi:flagellar basal body P-ring formation chaperone FlgA [Desulfobaculum bizertense]|uniref:flagellar basal body P-ring formation chaperone FlgA n=1 Tax=Desulfobaculum bizertense TaxID=376490 RepID=UPI001F3C02C2|nr:flagellar basal body P-ring formation chaperone FlgA [Desulfobaculum bizertense]UIJ39050.1 flagellar basal body P-ring formation chaperone FlgA [Desulfobaculum bizertense]